MPTVTFNDISELVVYINQYIIENGANQITGEQHNNVEIGLTQFIISSPRNWNRATIRNGAGLYSANSNECILIFRPTATGSLELVQNKWNEWLIVNQTGAVKFLTGDITTYRKLDGQLTNNIPPNTVIGIAKGVDNNWYEIENRPGGGVASVTNFDRIEFTIGASPSLMADGDTELILNIPGIKDDSLSVDLIGVGELPRTLSEQLNYNVDYPEVGESDVTITFNQGVQNSQTYIIRWAYA